jgi:MG2 domain/A-macroglobulin TED domain/Alpha-2-macroglobulin family/Carboxypeptidase regulatory-like domain/A-macroglobulin receptor binding domain/Alpha-2-macroglobulin bait region domain
MRGTLFAAVAACASAVFAQSSVTIDEAKIRAGLKNDSTIITIPVESSLDRSIGASLALNWVDNEEIVSGPVSRQVTIQPGRTSIEVPLPIRQSSIWMRLHYALAPDRSEARSFTPLAGIASLSHIAEHVFELKLSYAGVARRGSPITIYAQAVHPLTRAPVAGVEWKAKLTVDGEPLSPIRTSKNNATSVEFTFDVPAASEDDPDEEAQLDVSARNGDFKQRVLAELQLPTRFSGRFQTDKPIYQPGQTIHMRAIVMDPQGRAAEGAKVTLRVEDQDNERAHTAQLVSSRFGVVQDDWILPATAALGGYQITLTKEGDDDYRIAQHVVRVSRYELPTFNVVAKPDRGAYLPGQPAKVAITGTYMFGKPVPKGKVKVTRANETRWNPKTRKSEAADDTVAEGVAGEDGTFVAQFDLKGDYEDLQKSERQRFKDVHFAAYYTDPTSSRTEQRKFDVRITREPIHVYLIYTAAGGLLPAPLYVSTSYADGRPASANVDILFEGRTTSLRTNQYGVGRAYVPRGEEGSEETEARASDGNGQSGSWKERYWSSGSEQFRLATSRTLHRAGESVTLQITAPPEDTPDQFVMVNAIAEGRSIASQIVRLADRKAAVTFPYQHEFRRTVTFIAWNAASSHSVAGSNVMASKAVIFPDGSDLRVSATTERAVYKPGEKATLRMQVNSADGKPVEAALGLAVVDQAVLERARTDSEFGHRPWFECAFCKDDGETEIGGIRLNDLYKLKPATAISPELDLVAEALVARAGAFMWSESSETLADTPRFKNVASQMRQLGLLLDRQYSRSMEFPRDTSALVRVLGAQWSDLRDPWGRPYRAEFSVARENNVITIMSAGPDKQMGTADDFAVGTFRRSYFTPVWMLMEQILVKQENYPATDAEFRKLLSENGLLLESLRDPWGTPYRSRVNTWGTTRQVQISSAGPDCKFDTQDDFPIAEFSGTYFRREAAAIAKAVSVAAQSPQTNEEFIRVLEAAGIDISKFRDPWNKPYRLTNAISSHYVDRIDSKTVRIYGGQATARTSVTPVTQRLITFSLRSAGPDGIEDTYDDFDVVRVPVVLKEESAEPPLGARSQSVPRLSGTGIITGTVTDASGAVVPNAVVNLIDTAGTSYETSANQDGLYFFNSVPVGIYTIRALSLGFRSYEVSQVPVTADKTTTVDIRLDVGSVSEAVTVEAGAVVVQTSMASMAMAGPMATPRVRDYFPETLVWLPDIVTDARGASQTQFALADSVTTWKIALIASTLDGRIAETESDLRAFQPFFLDFNPPPVLTEGDQLDLPVTVRNYQDSEQKVNVSLQSNDWSAIDGPAARDITVGANSSANVTYTVHAKSSKDKAAQRIVALAGRNRDAIEKSVRVHPDGQETAQTTGDIVAGPTSFAVSIPTAAIAGATRAELRLYPNIASMLFESASAILITPHGCAEQTISAGYANLVALRFARSAGISDAKIEKRALANIRTAHDALAGFQGSDGGIRYWPKGGEADVAVTAYALSFLVDVSGIVPVDKDALRPLVGWLEKQQAADGTWKPGGTLFAPELASRRAVLLTSLVAKSLAAAQHAGVEVHATVLAGAYHHIARFTDQTDEPYMLAQFILAALDSGDEALLGNAVTRLTALKREERGGVYWDLRTNSPFYGWGKAGRFETTGLAVSALSAWRARHPASSELDAVVRHGLVFLLRGRDQWGCWYSTQSTVRAMRAMADASAVLGSVSGSGGNIEVRANGRLVKLVSVPNNPRATDPILVDLSAFLAAGDNQIELQPSAGARGLLTMRFASTHWLPWAQTQARSSPELRLAVQFDRLESNAGEPVRCSVKAERVGFRGYGMMLAEIGLPPGAEVDRASLETVVDEGTAGVDRYDVLPDRIVLYLWPRAGGVSFDFYLHARMTMVAKSGASVLYDYYNPEALSEVAPVRWVVK